MCNNRLFYLTFARDLKVSNLLMTDKGFVKIGKFLYFAFSLLFCYILIFGSASREKFFRMHVEVKVIILTQLTSAWQDTMEYQPSQ